MGIGTAIFGTRCRWSGHHVLVTGVHWRAAMDVLTSAASAHEAASEAQSSGEMSPISCEAQVLALKRKLIECDQQSRDQSESISGLEKALDIEKREHQLTTSKLTMLLKKRGSSCSQCDQRRAGASAVDMAGFESSPAWMASLRAASLPPAADSGSELPSHAQPRVCIRKAIQENSTAKRAAGVQDISPCAEKAPEPPAKASDSPAPDCSSAETLPLSASDSVSDSAPFPDSVRTAAAPPSSTSVPASPPPANNGGYRVPFGYVPGAISVELPKRQRTHKHHAGTAAMPRSYSSLT